MPLHVSPIHATDDFKIWHFHVISWGEIFLFFLKEDLCSFLSCAQWSKVPVAASTVNHACPFKYRTHESEIEQVPIYTSHGGKIKKKKKR